MRNQQATMSLLYVIAIIPALYLFHELNGRVPASAQVAIPLTIASLASLAIRIAVTRFTRR